MIGYVDSFFYNVINYINLLWSAEIIKYLLSFFVVMMVLAMLKQLLFINRD